MHKINTIALIGGGGRTGKFLVSKFLKQGYSIKVLLRNPKAFELESSKLEIVIGDSTDPGAIDRLINNSDCVVNTVGQRPGDPMVAASTTANVLSAMRKYQLNRYVVLAGLNIDAPLDKKGPETVMATNWMKANYPEIQEDRQNAYRLLVDSNVDWTLVRVPMIMFTDAISEVNVSLLDCLGNKISAANIAAFIARVIAEDGYKKEAPFIAEI
ncbi:NAD(P)-dependent oxidoreductase [Pedobacter sp. PWIIR3]